MMNIGVGLQPVIAIFVGFFGFIWAFSIWMTLVPNDLKVGRIGLWLKIAVFILGILDVVSMAYVAREIWPLPM